MIFDAVKTKHPEIVVIGTVGPSPDGDDFTKGWKFAKELKVPIVDEHYYTSPEWFISNQHRYDSYNRNSTQVYLGEYASWGNKMRNAIAEAAYMSSLERNGDVVRLASYAPLFAKKDYTQWKTDMVFFDNTKVCLTPNYYVQKMFSANQGDYYFGNVISKDEKDANLAASCVQDSKTGDVILKMVNFGKDAKPFKINLKNFGSIASQAEQTLLVGSEDAENALEKPNTVVPNISVVKIKKAFDYSAPAMSLTVFRLSTSKVVKK
jgi:alpha-L-arabinofuranosidase